MGDNESGKTKPGLNKAGSSIARRAASAKSISHAFAGLRQRTRTVAGLFVVMFLKACALLVLAPLSVVNFIGARPYMSIAIMVAIHLAVTIADPFDIDDAADRNTAQWLDASLSPLYGGIERPGQNAITVALIDQQTMENAGVTGWPPPYGMQVAIVEEIMAFCPKAVFLDFYYTSPQLHIREAYDFDRSGDAARLMRNYPEFFGPDSDEYKHVARFARDLAAAGATATHCEQFNSGGPRTPVFIGPIHQSNNILTPLRALTNDAAETGIYSVGLQYKGVPSAIYPQFDDEGRRQAAFALYEVFCTTSRAASTSPKTRGDCASRKDWMRRGLEELYVRWGFGAADSFWRNQAILARATPPATEEHDYSDEPRPACVVAGKEDLPAFIGKGAIGDIAIRMRRMIDFARFFASAAFDESDNAIGSGASAIADCAYHDYFSAALLFDSRNWRDQLGPLIKDRIVLVGQDVRYLRDYVDTPLTTTIPGVFLHAMALDNLIELGPEVRRPAKGNYYGADNADLLSALLLIAAASAFVAIHRLFPSHAGDRIDTTLRRYQLYGLTLSLLMVVALFLSIYVFHWPPLNIAELALAVFGAFAILEVLSPAMRE